MAKNQKRKYEKIDEPEIELVINSSDSHQFYERYREQFPDRKKGIDSISKIWKRRGEFLRKRQVFPQPDDEVNNISVQDLGPILREQNKIFTELTQLMKEQIIVSREILSHLSKGVPTEELRIEKREETKLQEHSEPMKRTSHEKPNEIMIGS